MPDQTRRDIDEWHLGIEGPEDHRPESSAQPPAQLPVPVSEPAPPPPPNLSHLRLDAPLYIVTVEHLGWAAVALYALITRLGALGLRPLSAIEAARALVADEIGRHGLTVLSVETLEAGWIDVMRAGVFLAFGESDFGARIVAALFGLALIAAAFAMRRQLGRAGALAFAAMLTASPTLTWFSRSASPTVPAIALVVIMLALMFALVGTTGTVMVIGVGVAIAAALSAEPIVLPIAAIFLAVLIVMGIGELIFRRHPMIRLRVWWERRFAQLAFCVAIAIGLFAVLESALGRRNLLVSIVYGAAGQWWPIVHPDLRAGLEFYLPALVFYEFAIAIFGLLGALAFVSFLLRSRVAVLAFLWMIFAGGFFLADPVHHQDWTVMMLVPAALMGAILIDTLHASAAWRWFRYPAALLMLLTIYVQLAANFVHFAPDSSEASWSRRLLLFWTDPATTTAAEEEFAHAERAVTDRGTAFLMEPSPVARWYLRDLKPTYNSADADLVVALANTGKPPNVRESFDFTLDEKWMPSLAEFTPASALRYFFTQRISTDVITTDVSVDVRSPAPANAAAPAPSPTAPAIASPMPSESATAEASTTPTAAPTATPTISATVPASPVPSIAPSPIATAAP